MDEYKEVVFATINLFINRKLANDATSKYEADMLQILKKIENNPRLDEYQKEVLKTEYARKIAEARTSINKTEEDFKRCFKMLIDNGYADLADNALKLSYMIEIRMEDD